MADGLTMTVDNSALLAALDRIPDAVMKRVLPAEKITADNIKNEAQSRIARATGKTGAGIYVADAWGETGYVVLMSDQVEANVLSQRASLGLKSAGSTYYQMKHIGLWLEYGTTKGSSGSHSSAARPFFWPSVQLEAGPHDRRIKQAIQDAIDDQHLGDGS